MEVVVKITLIQVILLVLGSNTTVLSETNSSSNTYSNINWDDVIKKEARGLGDANLGEVQEVRDDYIIAQKRCRT